MHRVLAALSPPSWGLVAGRALGPFLAPCVHVSGVCHLWCGL